MLLAVLCAVFLPTLVEAAPPSAAIAITPASTSVAAETSTTFNFSLTSQSEAVSAVSLKFTVPPGTTVVSSASTGSIFPTEVLAPSITNTTFTWERLRSDTGYLGTSGFIGSVTLRFTSPGNFLLDPAGLSQVLAYSDSTNILASSTPAEVAVTGAVPGSLSQTGSTAALAIGILVGASAGFMLLSKHRTRHKTRVSSKE